MRCLCPDWAFKYVYFLVVGCWERKMSTILQWSMRWAKRLMSVSLGLRAGLVVSRCVWMLLKSPAMTVYMSVQFRRASNTCVFIGVAGLLGGE